MEENMIRLGSAEIAALSSEYRRNFINTLAGFKSANLIGSCDDQGNTNLAVFNSVIHIGANPPLLGFILRPPTVPRHTYNNIRQTGYYTINHISNKFVKKAHKTSAKYQEGHSEFDAVGLEIQQSALHPAPYVAESRVKIGMKYVEEYEIKANGTILIVGQIVEIIMPADYVNADGFISLDLLDTVAISGLDAYYNATLLSRFSYARPEEDVHELE